MPIIKGNGTQIVLEYIFLASFTFFRIIKQRGFYALKSPISRGAGLVLKKKYYEGIIHC
jgi:hypothetical protein